MEKIFLINPAQVCSNMAVMSPRWMPAVAAATPEPFSGRQVLVDQSVEPLNIDAISSDDLVGISVHTLNARRSYELIREIKARTSAKVVVGGPHASVCPDEVKSHGADAVVTGDADLVWPEVVNDFSRKRLKEIYHGGRISGDQFVRRPRWDLLKHQRYLMATVHTTRGCPEACTFCSVWRTDGQRMRFRPMDHTIEEIRSLYDLGFRYIVIADDNFYGVGTRNTREHAEVMKERYAFLEALAKLPDDMVFGTQITIRVAQDARFLEAMSRARVRLVLVGIESVDKESLRSIHKDFNLAGEDIVRAIHTMQEHGVFVLGSHIVGLANDKASTYEATLDIALRSRMAFAQFVRYSYFPGTVDAELLKRGKHSLRLAEAGDRYWLNEGNGHSVEHPTMTASEISDWTRNLWKRFYSPGRVFQRAWQLGMRNPAQILLYMVASHVYYVVYCRHGVAADSVRTAQVGWLTRMFGHLALRLAKRRVSTVSTASGAAPDLGMVSSSPGA